MKDLAFLELIRDDLRQVEDLLRERPPEQHDAIQVAVDHLIGSGGKRLRPALVLLSAHIAGAAIDQAVFVAAAAEMLHTATLIHDDLIDGSLIRRGMETLNSNWPPGATVLTGDYVFARAAHLITRAGSIRLVRRFAETLMVICNGEVRQMFDGRHGTSAQLEYERRIYAKTASLLILAAEAGPILAGATEEMVGALRTYGEKLGLAFQIVDDVLDFVADEDKLGKPTGSDLRQGLITLPAMLFLEQDPDHPVVSRAVNEQVASEIVDEAVSVVAASPAIEQAMDVAGRYIKQAIAALDDVPDSDYRTSLIDLAQFTVDRRF